MMTTSMIDRRIDGNDSPFDSDAGRDLSRTDVRDAINVLDAAAGDAIAAWLIPQLDLSQRKVG
jgi:hypothetical protein